MVTVIPVGAKAEVFVPFEEGKGCFLDGEEFHDFVKPEGGYIRIGGVPSGRYEWSVR